MADKFHLGWFLNFVAEAWNEPLASVGGPDWTGAFYVDVARQLDRAGFDYVILEDKSMVSDAYGGTSEIDLKHAIVPKHDPVPLVPLIAQATKHLGIVPTMSTSFYPPYLLARLCSTLDHITGGRMGWNVVTSAEDRAAQNYGLDRLPDHDLRYDVADEYLELVNRLWASWDPDAVVMDREAGIYADHTKVHTVDFQGRFFRCRGPLNTVCPPQGRPVICQAGGSPRGRDFAARVADTIIATATGAEEMKAFRDDVRARMEMHGRKPDDCKVLFLISPIVAETEGEARTRKARMTADPNFIEATLAMISSITEIDFSVFDLDAPLPEVSTNGERGSLEKFVQKGRGRTLRELAMSGMTESVEFVGTPDQVADRMGALMETVGGDGFLITRPGIRLSRRYVTEITDGLVPALQRRGLTRTSYSFEHFRDNLLEF
jgi:FMN-dependent oxidoreductase (nitrilotriacetate monooxygenase family)